MKTLYSIAAVAAVTLLCAGCGILAGPERLYEKEFQIGKSESISVTTDTGSIAVESWSRSTMQVVARIRRTSILLEGTDPEAVEIVVDTSDGITVWALPEDRRHLSVSFEIFVPDSVSVEHLRTDTGSIVVSGLDFPGTAASETGSVTVTDSTGFPSLSTTTGSIVSRDGDGVRSATTGTGSIEVEFSSLPPVLLAPLSTDTGSITVRLADGLAVDLVGETGTGSVNVSSSLDFDGVSSGGRIDGSVAGGGITVDASTGTGSISFERL